MTLQLKKKKAISGLLTNFAKSIYQPAEAPEWGQTAAAVCFYIGLAKDDGKNSSKTTAPAR